MRLGPNDAQREPKKQKKKVLTMIFDSVNDVNDLGDRVRAQRQLELQRRVIGTKNKTTMRKESLTNHTLKFKVKNDDLRPPPVSTALWFGQISGVLFQTWLGEDILAPACVTPSMSALRC